MCERVNRVSYVEDMILCVCYLSRLHVAVLISMGLIVMVSALSHTH